MEAALADSRSFLSAFALALAELNDATNVDIEDVVLTEVTGEMDRNRALVYLKDNLKILRYEPIAIEGKTFSLTDLKGSTGWNIIEKGM